MAQEWIINAMDRKRIFFNNSMRSDKRDDRFAYWRQNVLTTHTAGLYPSKDFVTRKTIPTSSYQIEDVVESVDGTDIFLLTSGASTNIWYIWNFSDLNSTVGTSSARLCGAVAGGDGIYAVQNNLAGVSSVGRVTNTGFVFVANFPTNEIINNTVGLWDAEASVYYWINKNGIWQQEVGAAPVKVHNSIGADVLGACLYQGFIALLVSKLGSSSFTVLFWDKASGDPDLFDRRIDVINATPFGIATLAGKLTVIYAVGNTRNQKEFYGEMNVGQFDGYRFQIVNSWFSNTYRPMIYSSGACGVAYGVGNDVMVIPCATVSDKPGIHTRGAFYKINSDGEVMVEKSYPNKTTFPYKARVLFSRNVLVSSNNTNHYLDDNFENFNDFNYDDYENYSSTEYITNFLEDAYDLKKLNAVSFTFEKLFKNTNGSGGSETAEIYYRTSDREDFTLLATVTAQNVIDYTNKEANMTGSVPVLQQRYDISQMPDGSSLPSFNEIQFYFKIKNGMSIIDAFYEYEKITHTTFN